MKLIIKEFKNNFVCVELENGFIVEVPRVLVPLESKENDVIYITSQQEKIKESRKKIKEMVSVI